MTHPTSSRHRGQFCGRTRREFLWETGAGFGAVPRNQAEGLRAAVPYTHLAAARGPARRESAANGSTHNTYHGIAQPSVTISSANAHAAAVGQSRVRHVHSTSPRLTSTSATSSSPP